MQWPNKVFKNISQWWGLSVWGDHWFIWKRFAIRYVKSFHAQTSPTCQFGVSDKYKMINKSAQIHSKKILTEINKGHFIKLNKQMKNNYKDKDNSTKKNISMFAKTQKQLIKFWSKKK